MVNIQISLAVIEFLGSGGDMLSLVLLIVFLVWNLGISDLGDYRTKC